MPIYEYRCPQCGQDFELMRPFSQADEPAPCPSCGSSGEKLISVFASTLGFSIQVPAKPPLRESAGKSKKSKKRKRGPKASK